MARFCKLIKLSRYYLITLSLFAIHYSLFTACQEGSNAGDLLGQWRMAGSDTKHIGFSGSITIFRNLAEGEVFGNFQHVGDSLFIQCYSIDGLPSDTAMIEDSYGFRPFNNIRMKIESLDDDNLLLSKGNQKWSFYKY